MEKIFFHLLKNFFVNQKNGLKNFLPDSWEKHGKARCLVYANEELKVKKKCLKDNEDHLQSIVLEVGYGRSKTHLYNFYYREWKNCVTGQDNMNALIYNLKLMMDIWRRCASENKDFIASGDMNVDAKQWDESGYRLEQLANLIKDFMLEENCCQIVNDFTRIRQVQGVFNAHVLII